MDPTVCVFSSLNQPPRPLRLLVESEKAFDEFVQGPTVHGVGALAFEWY